MSLNRNDLERLGELVRQRCLRYGDFTLASGGKSKYYYNGKRITLRPSGAWLIGEALVDVVLAAGAEAVGGPALGAVPIACAVGLASLSRARELPVFVVRMEQKGHGARDLIAEPYADDDSGEAIRESPLLATGRRVAIVEDAVTTGGSVQKAIDAVEALGCRVVLVAVLVERHEGGGDALRTRGYNVVSIFRTDEEGQLSVNEAFLERMEAAQAKAG
ncbi:MAG: orotate phosphoribosyltransferase [Chloroflexi bacterium RBG_16_68_14]|nr:MAG: orotate phosphoribosyltransferase [Chloroflexi bacterium RBG_16_68_14]